MAKVFTIKVLMNDGRLPVDILGGLNDIFRTTSEDGESHIGDFVKDWGYGDQVHVKNGIERDEFDFEMDYLPE